MHRDFFEFVPPVQAAGRRQSPAAPQRRRRGDAPAPAPHPVRRSRSRRSGATSVWPRSSWPSGTAFSAGCSRAASNGGASVSRRRPGRWRASRDYFADEDLVGQWIAEHCCGWAACSAPARPRCFRQLVGLGRGRRVSTRAPRRSSATRSRRAGFEPVRKRRAAWLERDRSAALHGGPRNEPAPSQPHDAGRAPRRDLRDPGARADPPPGPTVKSNYLRRVEKVRLTSARPERSCNSELNGETHDDDRPDPRAPGGAEDHADARAEGSSGAISSTREPPPYNRRFLESRLAYRIQELAYGGLKPETVRAARGAGRGARRRQHDEAQRPRRRDRPIAGTRLIREWQGVEHCVTVRDDGFEWQGRPYKSLSAIARAITGTRWNGWVFFGLKNQRRRGMKPSRRSSASSAARSTPASPPRKGWSRSSTASTPSARPARPTSPASGPRAGCWCRDHYDDGGFSGGTLERPGPEAAARRHRGRAGRRRRRLQDRPAQPLADGLRQAGRGVRPERRHLRLGHPVVQHHHLAWAG